MENTATLPGGRTVPQLWLHVPGSLVLEGGQAWMALETADGVPWMVDAGGALSFLPSWEDYELSGEHRVTFFSPAA